jgi:hypothetical protein
MSVRERRGGRRAAGAAGVLARGLGLALVATALGGCEAEVAEPTQGIAVYIRAPLGAENPFKDPESAFVALVGEGPDISLEPQLAPSVLEPYSGPGMQLTLPALSYGKRRQIRVELYSKNVNGGPDFPVRGRGRTLPRDIEPGAAPQPAVAYVTPTNAWTTPISDLSVEAPLDARVGAGVEELADGSVLIAGGADVGDPSASPFSAAALGKLSQVVLRYDTEARVVQNLSVPPLSATLSQGRAMMATAAKADGQVVFSGGYVQGDVGPVASTLMEVWSPKEGKIRQATGATVPGLEYARAHHTLTRMFDNEELYIAAGGKGPAPEAALSTEIWHASNGRIAKGGLAGPRWNHATVRLPERDGGYIMLIGGENGSGPLDTFEVLRYDNKGNFSWAGNPKVTCELGQTSYDGADSTAVCASLASQPGYKEFRWQPLVGKLGGGVARTLPGAVFVMSGSANYVHIVGGFADTAHKQPLKRVDVFDISKGVWLSGVPQLEAARGAPQLAVTRGGSQRDRVVVVGGLGADGETVGRAELLLWDPVALAVQRDWAGPSEVPGGGRVLGRAIGLATGHVLVVGGATSGDGGFVAASRLGLYNPR